MDCFYCPRCADKLGRRPPMPTFDPLGSTYQRDKHEKHTKPGSSYRVQTVFDNSSTQYYEDCIKEAWEHGAVQIESRGTHIIYRPSTGSSVGSKYKWGKYANRQDTVVVLKTSEATEVHGILKASSQYEKLQCALCGGAIL